MHISSNQTQEKWIRPWNQEKFDEFYKRDDRFFGLLIKGTLAWLNKNIILYNKPIKHFIFNTGSSLMYVEANDYQFSWNETSTDNEIYMHRPRCVVELGDINIQTEELTQPNIRGVYERKNGNMIEGFNADIRRIPIEIDMTLTYVLSNFNESIVLTEELLSKILFQKYFKIVYLGELIECSIEFPQNFHIDLNKIDMTSTEVNQKLISVTIKVCSNYPLINEDTEISNSKVISKLASGVEAYANGDVNYSTDYEQKTVNIESKEDKDRINNVIYNREDIDKSMY